MANGDRRQFSTSESHRVFRRASLNHITFVEPGSQPQDYPISAPPRPKSAFARTSTFRPLSNILEVSPCSSESTETATNNFRDIKACHRVHVVKNPSPMSRINGSNTPALPLSRVPERKSSKNQLRVKLPRSRASEEMASPFDGTSYSGRGLGNTIPSHGQSTSPVRSIRNRFNPVSSDMRRIPSRTFVRSVKPIGLLEMPELNHPRVSVEMRVLAPLFVGGGTVEGEVHVMIDGGIKKERHKVRSEISIARICVDIMGVETALGKKFIFRGLANELIDTAHPPPASMLAASIAAPDGYWRVTPSISVLPFRLNLPVSMGPPPYSFKRASIKYIICTTLVMRIDGEQYWVRRSEEISVLTVHDPEKALVNLPNPLTASDELLFSFGTHKVIRLTAGVHRQTWVSGIALFVDIYISNNSDKTVKKIDLLLEKLTTFFDNAAASTKTEMAGHLRLPDHTDTEIVRRSSIKKARHGWQGILPQSRDVRTCRLDIPTGLVTVDAGRFFGVRFFLSVIAYPTRSKPLKVQIPISIIHPNSLDIPPNSLAQVASAIEHRLHTRSSTAGDRSSRPDSLSVMTDFPSASTPPISENVNGDGERRERREYRYAPGQAFAAARRQSVEQLFLSPRVREGREMRGAWSEGAGRELDCLVEESPRKMGTWAAGDGRGGFRVLMENNEGKPRLMRSTSGLGFDGEDGYDSEGEGEIVDEVPEPFNMDERDEKVGRKRRSSDMCTSETKASEIVGIEVGVIEGKKSELKERKKSEENEIQAIGECEAEMESSEASASKGGLFGTGKKIGGIGKKDTRKSDSRTSEGHCASAETGAGPRKVRKRQKSAEERALGRIRRELSAARRRGKGGIAGRWVNVAVEAVEEEEGERGR